VCGKDFLSFLFVPHTGQETVAAVKRKVEGTGRKGDKLRGRNKVESDLELHRTKKAQSREGISFLWR
jgi:hypothetical protein